MKHMKWSTIAKRGLAILLTIVMVLTVLPADGSAYAQSPDEDSEMSGSLSVLTEESEEPTTDTEESTENNMILGITTEAVTEDTEGDTGKDNAEDLSAEDGEEPSSDGAGNVTRGEWIHNLVTTFDMTVEDDEYPDNYFTDLDSSSEYYHDFLLAVEFGVLGDETGGEANVDAVATRGFAATTLNYCLGIQLDTTDYTFSDAADCTNPVDAQIAINQGWFTLVDGKFLPEQGITAEEMNAMLGNAGTLEASAEIEEGKKSNYTFADYVKVVPEGTQVTIDKNKTVTITDLPIVISEGDTFAVYTEISPYLFVAQSIQKSGNITTITTSEADEDAAIVDADVEEMTDLDLELLEGVDDSEVTYIETEAQAEQMEQELTALYADEMPADRVVTVRKDSVVVKKSIKVQDGASYNIAVTVDNIKVEKKLNSKTKNYVVAVSGRMTVVNSLTVDVIKGLGINNLILATVNIYGVNLTLSLNLSLGGALVSTYEADFRMGMQYTPSTKFRLISSFKKKKYTVVSEITASIGVKISANIDVLLAYAELYAEAGLKAKFSRTEYDSGEPSTCVNFLAYMYVTVGAYARFGLKNYLNFEASKEYQIYNEKNTPFYISFHYEDGKQVQKCTRGNKYGTTTRRSTYLNQGSSRYGYSTYGNGGSYGMGEGGVLYPLYTYSLDENNNATITGYNNASSIVSIPKTIDGYTVVKIGSNAFQNKTGITVVTIPDTVTEIGYGAFEDCTNLVKVGIADSVTKIGNYAFYNCTKLSDVDLPKGLVELGHWSFASTAITSITIPKALERSGGHNYGNIIAGPFWKCSNLKTVKFEKGITRIAEYTFAGCEGIEKVTIPDTVTELGDGAFSDCVNLQAITIPKKVQKLGDGAFRGCTGMTKVTILSDKLAIGSSVFADCMSLPEITLPDCITTITQSMFRGCTSLKKITYTDKVTEIESEAFKDCTSLLSFTCGKGITTIGDSAFYNCATMGSFVTDAKLTRIYSSAFYKCTSLSSVSLNEGLTNIGGNVFEYCASLKDITLPNSLTSLGSYAFAYCDVLETVKIGSGVTIIPSYAFYEDPALKSIVLPYQVQKVEAFAFGNCTILAKVYMNRNITSIADNAFSYPKKTTIYGVSGTYPETFADAKGFTFVNHEVHATKVTLSQSTIIMNQYEKQKLAMTVTPADFTDKVTWKSSNTGVVTVTENGQIESVGTGTSTVKVSVGDVSATCKVTVVQPVTSLYITEYSVYMDAYEQHQLKVNIYPDNAYNKKVAWSSSNPLVATVDANGLVEAKKKGTATITVTAQDGSNRKDTCTIYVQSDGHICKAVNELESVHPYKNNTNEFWQYTVKNAKTLNVTFDTRTEMEEDYDYLYIYDSKNNQIGKYTGKELAGKTLRITGDTVRIKLVSDDGGTAWGFKVTSVKANVTNVKVTKITLNKASANVERGKTLQLTATVTPTTATNKAVTWTSSNTKVATVSSSGKVTAKAVGTATITCTAKDGSGVKATCKVTVKKPVVKVSKITLNKTSASLIKGDTLALKATVTPATATNKAVIWKSSNTKIATVSSTGKVTAKAAGTVTITCTAKDGSGKKATCRITVRAYTKTEAYVARIYTKALGRQPEAGGLKYWTGEINAKRKTPVEVAEQFFFAPEFTNKKLSNTEYVKVLYRTFMGREADKGGLDYWVGRLNKGESRKSVLEAFAGCPEFQKIVKSFGL